jgi:uncharacterized protein (UPF0332 family)
MLAKAEDKLKVARVLLHEGAWDDCASRAYYAAFHAVSALHLSQGNAFSSHSQVIGRFNKDFVRAGLFPGRFTRIITRLFEDRQSGDYDVIGCITEAEARQDLEDASELVGAVRLYLESAHQPE